MIVSKKVSYVLKKPLRKKGIVGDVIKVAKGFGRYLESKEIAQRANEALLKDLEENKKNWQIQEAENEKNAIALIEKIKDIKIVLKRRVSQGDRLYESVRAEHLVKAFAERGIELHNNNVKINNQIKVLGSHTFIVHVYGNYEASITLEVISDEEII